MMPDMDGIETLHRLRKMTSNCCRNVPVICMTANAMSRMRDMYLKEGFDDYISKPIHGRELEKLMKMHLDPKKIQIPPERCLLQKPARQAAEITQDSGCFNQDLGLMYCGGEREFYGEILALFHSSYASKAAQIQDFYAKEDWKEYAIQVHALKSSALTLGAEELSEKARALELAAKAAVSDQEARAEKVRFIGENHGSAMALYKAAAEEAEQVAKGYGSE